MYFANKSKVIFSKSKDIANLGLEKFHIIGENSLGRKYLPTVSEKIENVLGPNNNRYTLSNSTYLSSEEENVMDTYSMSHSQKEYEYETYSTKRQHEDQEAVDMSLFELDLPLFPHDAPLMNKEEGKKFFEKVLRKTGGTENIEADIDGMSSVRSSLSLSIDFSESGFSTKLLFDPEDDSERVSKVLEVADTGEEGAQNDFHKDLKVSIIPVVKTTLKNTKENFDDTANERDNDDEDDDETIRDDIFPLVYSNEVFTNQTSSSLAPTPLASEAFSKRVVSTEERSDRTIKKMGMIPAFDSKDIQKDCEITSNRNEVFRLEKKLYDVKDKIAKIFQKKNLRAERKYGSICGRGEKRFRGIQERSNANIGIHYFLVNNRSHFNYYYCSLRNNSKRIDSRCFDAHKMSN